MPGYSEKVHEAARGAGRTTIRESNDKSGAGRIEAIWSALRRMYGEKQNILRDPLDVLVLTILSQNTNDINRDRAFAELKRRYPAWRDVAASDPGEIAAAIKTGGLADIKAPRIKMALERVARDFGAYSLDDLRKMEPKDGFDYLLSLDGVGEKTASCVLLFGCGYGVFPVDTHVFRIAKRLGLIDEKTSREEAHRVLGRIVPPELTYEIHVNMIEHGRRLCRPANPRCAPCELKLLCRYYDQKMGEGL